MPNTRILLGSVPIILILMVANSLPAIAADGDPLAIRRFPDGSVVVENHWGLKLIVSPGDTESQSSDPVGAKRVTFGTAIDHVLSRQPNDAEATWRSAKGEDTVGNAIRVMSMFDRNGDETYGLFVQADGVRMVFPSKSWGNDLAPPGEEAGDLFDLVVMPDGAALPMKGSLVDWIRKLHPRYLILPAGVDEQVAGQFGEAISAAKGIRQIDHNTIAIAKASSRDRRTELLELSTKPFELSEELESLFSKMENSCRASQDVFADLSVKQMNFRPANGTHTPRWNAEHMMGRQLLFFSQIYHEVDPTIPVMDLNPKQMPPDYVAAHPEWDGKEEARQMNRVSEFTRRFAYLVRDVDLDRQAPGSRWTLRGLLRQMERHYDDHTANTKMKFQLADWPSQ
ncbi:MAG: DinB family protein [Planctomycetales bacterium]|nr:DinB family protein [Planctomycetales bacterium]